MACVLLALAAAASFSRWNAYDLIIPWDAKAQFYNFFRFLAAAIHAGEAPFWNPYHYSGFPSIADPQSMVFTPTFLLLAIVDATPSMAQFDAYVLLHPLLGGCAVVMLCARRGLGFWPSLLAGLVFMLGGPATSRLQHVGQIVSYSALPVVLLVLERALEKPTLARAAFFGIAAGLMALCRDQVAYLNCLILIAFAFHAMGSAETPFLWLRQRLPALAAAGIGGAVVLIVPLLLTLQFAAISNRPIETFAAAAAGSYSPFNLLTALFPDLMGSLQDGTLYWGPGTSYWSENNWTDRAVNYSFFGTLPLTLLMGAIALNQQILTPKIRFFTCAAIALFLYTLGAYTPLFKPLYLYLPGVNLFRRPADAMFPLMFMLAMLIGWSADRLMQYEWHKNRATVAILFTLGLFSLLTLIAALERAPDHARMVLALTAMAKAIIVLVVLAGLWRAFHNRPALRATIAGLAVLLTAGELVMTNCGRLLNAEKRSLYAILDDARPSVDRDVMEQVRSLIRQEQDTGRRPRVEILGPENGWQNASMLYGVEDTLGYNPLRIAPYERATGAAETAHEPKQRPFPRSFRGYRSRLARLLGIEFLVFDTPFLRMPSGLMRDKLTIVREGPPYWVYRMPPAQPRAILVGRVRRTDTPETLATGEVPEFDLDTEALIEPNAPVEDLPDSDGTTADPVSGRVAISEYGLNHVRLVAESDAPALLVLHDILYPGWEVYVDGERKPLLRANLLFRGVEIGPGHHEILFEYRPLSAENLLSILNGL